YATPCNLGLHPNLGKPTGVIQSLPQVPIQGYGQDPPHAQGQPSQVSQPMEVLNPQVSQPLLAGAPAQFQTQSVPPNLPMSGSIGSISPSLLSISSASSSYTISSDLPCVVSTNPSRTTRANALPNNPIPSDLPQV
ncbi:hypothetical protein AMTR_s00054p00090680, partial [Amborella trichopoda]